MKKPFGVAIGLSEDGEAHVVALYEPADSEQTLPILMDQCADHLRTLKEKGPFAIQHYLKDYRSFYVFPVTQVADTYVLYRTTCVYSALLPDGGIASLPILTWGSQLRSVERDLLQKLAERTIP